MTAEPIQLFGNPFDAVAAAYDSSFTHTRLGKWLRAAVWRRLEACMANCRRLLDVGCGTGEDAIHLASLGFRVVATDSSAAMLEVAKEKAKQAGVLNRVSFHCLPMEQLEPALAGQTFDGVYSNFGAINCAASVEATLASLAKLMKEDARMLLVAMGRYVPWEWAWYLAHGKPGKAFRRLGRHDTDWRGMKVKYPSPGMLRWALPAELMRVSNHGLGIILPPSYASAWLEGSPRLFDVLCRIEARLATLQPLAMIGDHYIMETRKCLTTPND